MALFIWNGCFQNWRCRSRFSRTIMPQAKYAISRQIFHVDRTHALDLFSQLTQTFWWWSTTTASVFFVATIFPHHFCFVLFFSFTHCRNSNLDKTMWIRSIYYLFFLLGCKRRTVLCMNAHITWKVPSVYSEFCFYKERQLSPRWWWTRATDWSAPTKLLENSFQNQVAFLWSPKNLKTL